MKCQDFSGVPGSVLKFQVFQDVSEFCFCLSVHHPHRCFHVGFVARFRISRELSANISMWTVSWNLKESKTQLCLHEIRTWNCQCHASFLSQKSCSKLCDSCRKRQFRKTYNCSQNSHALLNILETAFRLFLGRKVTLKVHKKAKSDSDFNYALRTFSLCSFSDKRNCFNQMADSDGGHAFSGATGSSAAFTSTDPVRRPRIRPLSKAHQESQQTGQVLCCSSSLLTERYFQAQLSGAEGTCDMSLDLPTVWQGFGPELLSTMLATLSSRNRICVWCVRYDAHPDLRLTKNTVENPCGNSFDNWWTTTSQQTTWKPNKVYLFEFARAFLSLHCFAQRVTLRSFPPQTSPHPCTVVEGAQCAQVTAE